MSLLPAAAPEAPRPGHDQAANPKPLAGLKILVTEDVKVDQEIPAKILEDVGAEVTIAGNGQLAVDRVCGGPTGAFGVVLMDIQMPVMNGHDAAREILRQRTGPPIIGQTAHALAEEQPACLRSGLVDHVSKSIDPERLYAVIIRETAVGPRMLNAESQRAWRYAEKR